VFLFNNFECRIGKEFSTFVTPLVKLLFRGDIFGRLKGVCFGGALLDSGGGFECSDDFMSNSVGTH
jgi:hypothetical protein